MINLIKNWLQLRKTSNLLEEHPYLQDRFWELDDFTQELDDRLDKVEQDSHPCKELHEFDAYPELMKRIEKLETIVGKLSKEND